MPDEIHELTTDGSILATVPGFGDDPTGLAFDGRYLWHSDNSEDTIYKIDPSNMTVVDSFVSPGSFPNDLAWDGRYLWVVDNGTDILYQFDVGVPPPGIGRADTTANGVDRLGFALGGLGIGSCSPLQADLNPPNGKRNGYRSARRLGILDGFAWRPTPVRPISAAIHHMTLDTASSSPDQSFETLLFLLRQTGF